MVSSLSGDVVDAGVGLDLMVDVVVSLELPRYMVVISIVELAWLFVDVALPSLRDSYSSHQSGGPIQISVVRSGSSSSWETME